MTSRKPCEVSAPTEEPTWAETKRPQAAPAIARPMRSRMCATFLTPSRMGLLRRWLDGSLAHLGGAKNGSKETMLRYRAPKLVTPNSAFWVEGCERQYCGGAATSPPSAAAACQP